MKFAKIIVSNLLLMTLVMGTRVLGQPSQEVSIDLYSTALVEASKEMGKRWTGLDNGAGQTSTDYTHLVVHKDASVSASYPAYSGGQRFEYLTSAELLSRRRAARRDFSVLNVSPAMIEGARLKVVVGQSWATVINGHLGLGFSGWGVVYFRFDCSTGKFVFDEVQLGGI